jgi:hypothetical protein
LLDVIIRINEIGVDASLLQSNVDLTLYLLFLGLLDSDAKLLVLSPEEQMPRRERQAS